MKLASVTLLSMRIHVWIVTLGQYILEFSLEDVAIPATLKVGKAIRE